MFGCVCNVMNQETHHNEKTILLYSKEQDAFARTYDELLAAMETSSMLKTFNKNTGAFGDSKWCYYQLADTTVSRKKYEKMLRAFYA